MVKRREDRVVERFADELAELCARVRSELPDIEIDDDTLIEAILAHATEATIETHLAQCRPAELALAAAAARGSQSAIAEIERRYAVTINATCRRYARAAHSSDDLRQILRQKLFVGDAPSIADYNGHGSLEAWLRVTATRCFIDLGRRKDRAREVLADDYLGRVAFDRDLELDAIKAEYRGAVAAALRAAADALDAADRHLLRQHLVAGLSIDQFSTVLGIHRATAARRIQRAREQLITGVREHLTENLRLDERELAEVFALVISKLDISMRTLLATPPGHS